MELENKLNDIASKFKTSTVNINDAISKTKEDIKNYENTIKELNQKLIKYQLNDILSEIEEYNGINLLIKSFENKDISELKEMVDRIKEKVDNIVILFSSKTDKAIFVSGVSKNISNKYNAGLIVKNAAIIAGGNGGGRPDFAQAGAKEIEKIEEAIKSTTEYIKGI